jgi:hypothetical protein
MKKIVALFLCLQIVILTPAMAQQDDIIKSTQNDILLVAGAGAAGAVLGLSTLSFVKTPSKHLANIWTGAAIGVIVGVVFVAYNSAQRGTIDLQSSKQFNTSERLAWHLSHEENLTQSNDQYGSQVWSMSF